MTVSQQNESRAGGLTSRVTGASGQPAAAPGRARLVTADIGSGRPSAAVFERI
jgi:hypothetical protein